MTDTSSPSPADIAAAHPVRSFTQHEVDAQVRTALRDQRFQYTQAQAQAEAAANLEKRLDSSRASLDFAEGIALRTEVANRYGIASEDRDILLTASDEAGLTAQAERVAALDTAERLRGANVAPREGNVRITHTGDAELQQFAKMLFNSAPEEY